MRFDKKGLKKWAMKKLFPGEKAENLDYDRIMAFLCEEIKSCRRRDKDGTRLPNKYRIFLHPYDYQRLAARRMLDDIEAGIKRECILLDAFIRDELQVSFVEDKQVAKGDCELELRFIADQRLPEATVADTSTLVLKREDLIQPFNISARRYLARLLPVDEQAGLEELELSEKQVFIGRSTSNDYVLTDPNISRMHAVVKYDKYRHYIQDNNSLNGVFVNGKRVEGFYLRHGDRLQLGETVLQYFVL